MHFGVLLTSIHFFIASVNCDASADNDKVSVDDCNDTISQLQQQIKEIRDNQEAAQVENTLDLILDLPANQTYNVSSLVEHFVPKLPSRLREKFAAIPALEQEHGESVLFAAVNESLIVIKTLVLRGANPKLQYIDGDSLVFDAIKYDNLKLVQYIVEHAGLNASKPQFKPHLISETTLSYAASLGHLDIVKYLVNEGKVDINHGTLFGYKPIEIASKNGYLDIVKFLIEKSGSFEIANKGNPMLDHDTSLHLAVYNGHLNIVKYLVETAQVNINVIDNSRKTPLFVATYYENFDIVKFLIEHGADLTIGAYETHGTTPLLQAANNGNLNILIYILNNTNSSLNDRDINGKNVLHYAAEGNRVDIAKYLIAQGMDVNDQSSVGLTPLHLAARYEKMEMIKYLIQNVSANVEAKDFLGRTALVEAAFYNRLNVIKYLYEDIGADIIAKDNNNDTSLFWSIKYFAEGENVIVYLSSKLKEHIFDKNNIGYTALHLAAVRNNYFAVKYLINTLGLNVNEKDNEGNTPLHLAVIQEHMHVLRYLIEDAHANWNIINNKGETPLAVTQNTKIKEYLLNYYNN